MPSLRPNFIFRGARFATITTSPTDQFGGVVGGLDAGENVPGFGAPGEGQLEEFVGTFHMIGGDDAPRPADRRP